MLRDLFKSFTGGGRSTNPPAAGGNDPMFDEDFAEFVNNEYTQRQSERRSFEMIWRLNSEFVDGNQYLEINPVTNSLEEVPKLSWYAEREVFNQLGVILETRCAKISRQKPSLRTRPASGDDVDISAAKITSMLLGSTWHDQLMDEQYEDFISWMELTGTAFIKTVWNKNKGRVVISAQQIQELSGQPQQPQELSDPVEGAANESVSGITQNPPVMDIREGEIETCVVPPHEIFPDSSYRRGMRDCRSVIHAKAYHIQEVAEIWGVEVDPEDVDLLTLQRVSNTLGGLGYGYGSVRTTAKPVKNHVTVKEYYERPSLKYPQGRFIVVAGKKTLHAGPLPYQLGQNGEPDFPIVRSVSIDRPGCFWGKSVIERCIGIQRRYNALRNRKAEYLNMVSIGSWYAPIGSLDEGTELNNAPGNIIWYRPGANGAKPEPVFWPNLPSSFEMEEQTLMQEFTSVSGVSELSRMAEAPSGVKSGVALAAATEQDDTKISSTVTKAANAMIATGRNWVRLYRQFVQEPRLLRYIGGNREADVREWLRSDLRSDDVFIENMAALAESPAQRRQMVFDLLNAGLFARPDLSPLTEDSRQKVFNLLQFGHWESGFEDDTYLHKSRARRENNLAIAGIPLQVMDFDDHMIHIQAHNRQRMQAEWDELMKSPEGMMANQIMMAHIAEHIQLAIQAMPKEPVQQQPNNQPPKKESAPAKG